MKNRDICKDNCRPQKGLELIMLSKHVTCSSYHETDLYITMSMKKSVSLFFRHFHAVVFISTKFGMVEEDLPGKDTEA
jgi:hypothetical protein